jgi:hypothetical protein
MNPLTFSQAKGSRGRINHHADEVIFIVLDLNLQNPWN